MVRLGLPYIDLVCVDMYPLRDAIAQPDATTESVIELTDIGGPTMLRSAAKGRRIVICDPADRQPVIDWLKAGELDREDFITTLCAMAESAVASYCLYSANFHSGGAIDGLIGFEHRRCGYGENRQQTPAALFSTATDDPLALDNFEQIGGAAPSYNNFCDIDRLLATMTHASAAFARRGSRHCIAIAVKHGNPCGAAFAPTCMAAIKLMAQGDPLAIFGGSVMTNFPLDEELAELLMTHDCEPGQRRLLDSIVAPKINAAAMEMMARKGDKCRFFVNPALTELDADCMNRAPLIRPVRGGFLMQPNYLLIPDLDNEDFFWSGRRLSQQEELDMLFAWAVGSTSNSNTITLVRHGQLVGNGVGQQARVYGCRLAVERAGNRALNAIAYSDSFFPELDGPRVLADACVDAILTTSGSVRDREVIEYCRQAEVTLVMIPDHLGRGFFRH